MEEERELPNNQLRQPFLPPCFGVLFFSFLSCLAWLGRRGMYDVYVWNVGMSEKQIR